MSKKQSILIVVVAVAIVLLLVYGISVPDSGGTVNPVAEWLDNLDDGLLKAQQDNRVVLLMFTGSDWCTWCRKLMKEVFNTEEFLEYAEKNLVLVMIDFPRNKPQSPETKEYNRSLENRFQIPGVPTVLLIRPDGKVLHRTGYLQGGAANYIFTLEQALQGSR